MALALTIFGLMAGVVSCVALLIYDPLRSRADQYIEKKTKWATEELDVMFVDVAQKRLRMFFIIGPLIGGAGGWFLLNGIIGLGAGAALGAIIPQLYIMRLKSQRMGKFQSQLVDALMLMSSSLKAGLSILQAFDVVVEEMPAPISQEFGLLLKENKMGIAFQDTLLRLKQRLPSDDLNLLVTTVLVARETGGDVTEVFSKLIETLRERKKMKERVKTLTVQSRLQGIIMMFLPIGFVLLARSFNPHFFDIFLHDPLGRTLLGVAIVLEVVGAFLIWLFGRVPA